jgi:integrase
VEGESLSTDDDRNRAKGWQEEGEKMKRARKTLRRLNGEGSLMKVNGCRFWYAQYYQHGRQIRLSTRTTVRQVALEVLRKQMGDRDRGLAPLTDVRKITYADLRAGLIASYVEKGNKSLKTRANGDETICGLPQLDEFFGYGENSRGPSVQQITTDSARAFAEKRKKQGAGNAVINRSLACLRRMLKIAHEDGKLPTLPIIRLLKEPSPRRGFVEVSELEKLVAVLPTHLRSYVTFLYYCGGRSGEAGLIEWPQVDLARRVIRLEDHQTKNEDARYVPLPSRLVARLGEMKPKVGRVFDTTNLRKEWMTACVACGLGRKIEVPEKPYDPRYEGLTLHDLRRSAARNLLLAGVPETIIMKIGGWKTRSVFDRYAVANTADLSAAMRRFETATLYLLPENGERIVKNQAAAGA